jgi:hypothetical protein
MAGDLDKIKKRGTVLLWVSLLRLSRVSLSRWPCSDLLPKEHCSKKDHDKTVGLFCYGQPSSSFTSHCILFAFALSDWLEFG